MSQFCLPGPSCQHHRQTGGQYPLPSYARLAGLFAALMICLAVPADAQESPTIDLDRGAGTEIAVATSLTSLLEKGGEPSSIVQLKELEAQQRAVAAAVVDCTVSVKIGPAQGCGVIISASGYVLTAAHVAMRPGLTAHLMLSDGRVVLATTLGMNRHVDAGLIKIDPNQNGGKAWPYASLGSSEKLRRGMWCIATGHPGGYDMKRGPVTRIGRILAVRDTAIVTDCALIGGDSGGPLFDISGHLIAVHSRIGNDVADNLHVPIDFYQSSWKDMQRSIAWGYLPGFKPVLGVTGSKSADQAIVGIVRAGSPADLAGVLPGDVIAEFGDKTLSNFDSLKAAVDDTMPGERVRLMIIRDGKSVFLKVEIGRAN